MKNIRNDPEDTGNEHIVLVSNGNTSSDNSVKGWGHDLFVFWIKDILAEKPEYYGNPVMTKQRHEYAVLNPLSFLLGNKFFSDSFFF